MPFEFITSERDGAILTITLNRPDKLNALSPALTGEVVDALNEVRADSDLRVVIITGKGKAFAAGADIQKMVDSTPLDTLSRQFGKDMWQTVAKFPRPTIAAVNGYAFGGGCELAMACDLRIAAETAKFGQPEINLGIFPGAGGTQRLSRLVGLGRAKELNFLGEPFDAQEAYRIGLVNKVVPADKLMEEANAMAVKIASKPPATLQVLKQVMNEGYDLTLDNALLMERLAFAGLFGSEDQREGMQAFLEKRPPLFTGK